MKNLAVETKSLCRYFKTKRHKVRSAKKAQSEKKETSSLALRLVKALENVNLEVGKGELFGLLGPNGAGKTTLIKILVTLLLPSSGEAFVNGFNVAKEPKSVRKVISMVSGGEVCGYGILTTRENLWMFSQLYGMPFKEARQNINQMLEVTGLEEVADVKMHQLSTGMRQKMNFARGFITDPEIIFLDEPTLGLDVNAAHRIRNFLKDWITKREGRSIILTTHYMMEADELCDRLAIIDEGIVKACDSPANLKSLVEKETQLTLKVSYLANPREVLANITNLKYLAYENDAEEQITTLKLLLKDESKCDKVSTGLPVVSEILQRLSQAGCCIHNLQSKESTLEDVFIKLVGAGISERDKKENDK